jgi:hypothetical protein
MEKKLTFFKARMDIHKANVYAQNLMMNQSISKLEAITLSQLADRAAASALELKKDMENTKLTGAT